MLAFLLFLPIAAALLSLALPDAWRLRLLQGTAAAHLVALAALWRAPPQAALGGWVGMDAPALLVLGVKPQER